jgi:hypothetical protein
MLPVYATAKLTPTQVSAIQRLFSKFGKTFWIQPEHVRGSDTVSVKIFGNKHEFSSIWKKLPKDKQSPTGFDTFFDACYEQLSSRYQLVN